MVSLFDYIVSDSFEPWKHLESCVILPTVTEMDCKVSQAEPLISRHTRLRIPSSRRSYISIPDQRKAPRPRISEPFGPVTSSRGPNLIRSQKFTLVAGIEACGSSEPLKDENCTKSRPLAPDMLAGSPKPDTTPGEASRTRPQSDSCRYTPSSSSRYTHGNSRSKNVSMARIIPRPDDMKPAQTRLGLLKTNENIRFGTLHTEKLKYSLNNKLPKSRTTGVLQDLKTSLSRPTLTVRSANSSSVSLLREAKSQSSSSNILPIKDSDQDSDLTATAQNEQRFQDPPRGCEARWEQITAAHPSSYWTGRFISVHDKLSSEELIPKPGELASSLLSPLAVALDPFLSTLPSNRITPYRPGKLCKSGATTALTAITPSRVAKSDNGDDRCRRVFAHLDSLCVTSDARRSLRDWQQKYARQQGKADLLPPGGSMEDKGGLIMKLFGGGARKGGRQSLATAKDLAGKRTGKMNGRGKRLSVT